MAVTRYIDASVSSSGDGTTWGTAWKTLSNITGLTGGGNIVEFAGGSYAASSWQPVGGTVGNPNIYRVAQDGVHTGMVTFTSTGSQFLNGALANVTIDGRYGNQKLITISSSFEYAVYDPNGAPSMQNMKFLGWNFSSLIYCYGYGIEIGWCVGDAPLSGLDDSFIAHIGDNGPVDDWGINSIHDCVITVPRIKTQGLGWDAIKWGQNMDIYNNVFRAVYNAAYAGSQHNDAIQSSGNYIRVYNNYFENFLSYCWLNEIFDSSDAAHYRIYNNVAYYSNESGVDWTAQAFCWFGGNPSTTASASLTDLIYANNTIISDVGNTRGSLFCPNYPAQNPAVGADCYFVNNAADDFAPLAQVGVGVVLNNVEDSTVAQVVNKALYPNGDFHPTATATALIDQGVSPAYLTAVFTTDKDGNARTGTWDRGAYEYGSSEGEPEPPAVSVAITGNFNVNHLIVG